MVEQRNEIRRFHFVSELLKCFKPNITQIINAVEIIRAWECYDRERCVLRLAYILATAWHESRLLCVREKRARKGTKVWELQERYWSTGFYGRGFPQLTWEENYRKEGERIGIDLVKNPDLALNPFYSADILCSGIMKGSFTGVGLAKYVNWAKQDFVNARRTVNGLDKANLISDYAINILSFLEK